MTFLSAPIHVHWEITHRCNLKCMHCYIRKNPIKKELKTREIIKIINDIGKNKVFRLSISGGEPFLRYDILKILKEAKKYKIITSISSNGWFITNSNAKEMTYSLRLKPQVSGSVKEIQRCDALSA